MAEHLGPLLRLWGITPAQLPAAEETPDSLAPFLISILQEAVPFADSVAPKSGDPPSNQLWRKKKSSSHRSSAAPVTILERTIPSESLDTVAARSAPPALGTGRAKLDPETWACRLSVHADEAAPGTASWAEFRTGFKDHHMETEDAFTPSVVGARRARTWDCGAVEAEEGGETWGNFTLAVVEMRHKVGRPVLSDRTFPVLQMTCSAMAPGAEDASAGAETNGAGVDAAAVRRQEKTEFLVVSIPVNDFAGSEFAQLAKAKGTVVGSYASVERIRKLPESGEIEWLMATASDAKGNLPMWLQTKAVPGQIVKDVFLYLDWVAKEREKEQKQNGTPSSGQDQAANE